jgi:hypothetical protein
MIPVKTLVMIFQNQGGSTVRVSVDNVKDGITDAEVKNAMQLIIDRNIFESDGGEFTAISGAEIITRTVQELAVK